MNATASTESLTESLSKPQVLVVDDTPDNLALMSDLLRDTCKVRVANSGERALRLLGNGPPPDLILLDIMMPGMDGYAVIRALKANPQTRDIPVLFLTAKSEVEDERIGLELGAVDYLTKPVSHAILQARLKIHLALKAQADFLQGFELALMRQQLSLPFGQLFCRMFVFARQAAQLQQRTHLPRQGLERLNHV